MKVKCITNFLFNTLGSTILSAYIKVIKCFNLCVYYVKKNRQFIYIGWSTKEKCKLLLKKKILWYYSPVISNFFNRSGSFKLRKKPTNTVWMEDTKLKNLIICHPEVSCWYLDSSVIKRTTTADFNITISNIIAFWYALIC